MGEDGILKACLVDCDAETRRFRRARWRRALLVSLIFEAVLVAGLILWPIFTPGGPPPHVVLLPKIFPGDEFNKAPTRQVRQTAARQPDWISHPVFQAIRNSPRRPISNPSPPSDFPPSGFGNASQDSLGKIPGALSGLDTGNWNIAPPKVKSPRIVRKSEGVQSGMLIHRVEPLYPAIARRARISGTVELRAIIGRDGAVRSVEVLAGNPLLARAAAAAVWQWRYRPTFLDGQAVEVETRITVNFVMGQ